MLNQGGVSRPLRPVKQRPPTQKRIKGLKTQKSGQKDNSLQVSRLQTTTKKKAISVIAIGGLLRCKRPPIRPQKTANCNPKGHVLRCKRPPLASQNCSSECEEGARRGARRPFPTQPFPIFQIADVKKTERQIVNIYKKRTAY